MGYKRLGKINTIVFIILLSMLIAAPSSFANDAKDVSNAVDTKVTTKTKAVKKVDNEVKNTKTAPLKSFFARFTRKKKASNIKETILVQPAVQQGDIVYNIDDCVKIGIKNSHTLKNKLNNVKALKNDIGIARSTYFPTFSAGVGYNYKYSKEFGDSSDSMNSSGIGVNAKISETIWDFGRTTARINMAKFSEQAAEYEYRSAKLGCIFGVKLAYTYVLAAKSASDVWVQTVKINQLNLDRTKAMFEVGLKSKIDVVNAESKLTEAQISLLESKNAYQNALISLNTSMNYVNAPAYSIVPTENFNIGGSNVVKNEIDVSFDKKKITENGSSTGFKDGAIFTTGIEKSGIISSYKLEPYTATMQESINTAFQNRSDLKAMKLVAKASEESLKAIKRSYYPSLNATGSYSLTKNSDVGSNSIGIYGGLDLPNINAMSLKHQIEQGKAYLDIANTNVEELENEIFFQIQSLYVDMKQIEEKIPLMRHKVQVALENFELADGRYAVGLGNYLELQEALTDYNNAQLSFVESVFSYNKARFALEKAMAIAQPY
ncbi:MAG: TolC family protein [bacterium]|nr:TolC family protein [bacterium]